MSTAVVTTARPNTARVNTARPNTARMSTARPGTASTSAAHVQSRLRLTRRGRFVFASLVALPLAVVAGAFALNGGVAIASGAAASATFEYVQVETGQSLWQLAAQIAPDADPREVVSDIVHLNQLPSADVQPGQQLAVPATYSE